MIITFVVANNFISN